MIEMNGRNVHTVSTVERPDHVNTVLFNLIITNENIHFTNQ